MFDSALYLLPLSFSSQTGNALEATNDIKAWSARLRGHRCFLCVQEQERRS